MPVTVGIEGASSPSSRGGLAALAWSLRLPGGCAVTTREIPVFDDRYEGVGLFPSFTVPGLRLGHRVRLDLTGPVGPDSWGGGGDGGLAEEGGPRALAQELGGKPPSRSPGRRPSAVRRTEGGGPHPGSAAPPGP